MENMNNILGMKLFFTHSRNEKLREVKREKEREESSMPLYTIGATGLHLGESFELVTFFISSRFCECPSPLSKTHVLGL